MGCGGGGGSDDDDDSDNDDDDSDYGDSLVVLRERCLKTPYISKPHQTMHHEPSTLNPKPVVIIREQCERKRPLQVLHHVARQMRRLSHNNIE